MRINQVETAVGITKKNIRFYEEAGLLHPRRDAANGYREYSQQDVERLRKIKLLRRLDVPLVQIQQMLDGELTLAQGMQQHIQELDKRRQNLQAAVQACQMLAEKFNGLDQLDAAAALEELEHKEAKQEVCFVDVEKTDRKTQRRWSAVLGAGLFSLMMCFLIGIILWGQSADPLPLPLIMVLLAIPTLSIIGVCVVLVQRLQEIGKGEADAYRNY